MCPRSEEDSRSLITQPSDIVTALETGFEKYRNPQRYPHLLLAYLDLQGQLPSDIEAPDPFIVMSEMKELIEDDPNHTVLRSEAADQETLYFQVPMKASCQRQRIRSY